jgi:hypothetical protein
VFLTKTAKSQFVSNPGIFDRGYQHAGIGN